MKQTGQLKRRQFLQTSLGAAAAGVAFPYIIPRSALASEKAPGANDRIGVAIVGMGTRGNQHCDNMPAGAQIVAVCDCDQPKAEAAAKRLSAKWDIVHDYRKLFDRKDVDAVIVCPTDPHHVLASMLACQAGKDVYCEKPLSLTIAEGRALVRAARKYNRVVQTGTQQRTMEMDRYACELVRDGRLGKVKKVTCVAFPSPEEIPVLAAEPVPAGLDWDLWLGPTPDRPYNKSLHVDFWGKWRDYAGASITFLGAHAFDMIQYALGTDDTGPVELWPLEPGIGGTLMFKYANGIEVGLTMPNTKPYRGPRNGAIFTCENAKIEINRNKFTTNPKDFVKGGPSEEVAKVWNGPGWIAKGHLQNWIDCIHSRGKPNADVEIGHRSASICHLINITRQLGRRLQWDPNREIFPHDEEANALLTRPRRKGWELPTV
jgi:predicted dehydrogenase